MATLSEVIDHLVMEHDDHMKQAYRQLMEGGEPDELSIHWAYGAGMLHVIRTIQDGMRGR